VDRERREGCTRVLESVVISDFQSLELCLSLP